MQHGRALRKMILETGENLMVWEWNEEHGRIWKMLRLEASVDYELLNYAALFGFFTLLKE